MIKIFEGDNALGIYAEVDPITPATTDTVSEDGVPLEPTNEMIPSDMPEATLESVRDAVDALSYALLAVKFEDTRLTREDIEGRWDLADLEEVRQLSPLREFQSTPMYRGADSYRWVASLDPRARHARPSGGKLVFLGLDVGRNPPSVHIHIADDRD